MMWSENISLILQTSPVIGSQPIRFSLSDAHLKETDQPISDATCFVWPLNITIYYSHIIL